MLCRRQLSQVRALKDHDCSLVIAQQVALSRMLYGVTFLSPTIQLQQCLTEERNLLAFSSIISLKVKFSHQLVLRCGALSRGSTVSVEMQ